MIADEKSLLISRAHVVDADRSSSSTLLKSTLRMMEFTAKDEPVMPSPETTTRRMTNHVRSGIACGIWENIRRLEDFSPLRLGPGLHATWTAGAPSPSRAQVPGPGSPVNLPLLKHFRSAGCAVHNPRRARCGSAASRRYRFCGAGKRYRTRPRCHRRRNRSATRCPKSWT